MLSKEWQAGDAELHLSDKLLQPGWAGYLNPAEMAYIKSELRRSPSLKRRWGFRPTGRRFPENRIRLGALHGPLADRKADFRHNRKTH